MFWFVTGVFAVDAPSIRHLERVWEMLGNRPRGVIDGTGAVKLG